MHPSPLIFKKSLKLILLGALAAGCTTVDLAKDALPTPNQDVLRKNMVAFLEVSQPNRSVGQEGHAKAFQYLKAQFDEIAKLKNGPDLPKKPTHTILSQRVEIQSETEKEQLSQKAHVYVQTFLPDVDFAVKNYKKDFDTMVRPNFKPDSAEFKKWAHFTSEAIKFVEKYREIEGQNLILDFPGTKYPNEVIYVGAHYDTITHNHATMEFTPDNVAPGADDNASAVIALLAAARAVAPTKHDRTIRFVLFDYEEIFFLGSYGLAKDLSGQKLKYFSPFEKVQGLFNLEMVGWSTKKLPDGDLSKAKPQDLPVVKLYTREKKDPGNEEDNLLAANFLKSSLALKLPLNPVIMANGFNRSDNWSFWTWSYPSVCVTEDWEKDFNEANYHTSGDKPETLNFFYLANITRALTEALREFGYHTLLN